MGATKDGRHCTTIFADASFCLSNKVGGWGSWCKSDRGTATSGGEILFVGDSGLAELIAVSKGIFAAVQVGVLAAGDHVVIKTDCERVVRMFGSRSPVMKPYEETIVRDIVEFMFVNDISMSVQHVKGHSNSKAAPKFWVNNRCDKVAKTYMQQARNHRARGFSRAITTEIMLEPA